MACDDPFLPLLHGVAERSDTIMNNEVPYTAYKASTDDVNLGLRGRPAYCSRKQVMVLAVVGSITVGLIFGLLIGVFTREKSTDMEMTVVQTLVNQSLTSKTFSFADLDDAVSQIDGNRMATFVREYFQGQGQQLMPASADTRRESMRLMSLWKSHGIIATTVNKTVLISKPGETNMMKIIENGTVTVLHTAIAGSSTSVPPFIAYTPSGNVTGLPIFANYGRLSDFAALPNSSVLLGKSSGINKTVVVMRYGKLNVYDKLQNAALWGAAAAVLYPDLDEYKLGESTTLFANAKYLPGDPSTPSIGVISDTTYNIGAVEAAGYGSAIPALTVSAQAARTLLSTVMATAEQTSAEPPTNTWRAFGRALYPGSAFSLSPLLNVESGNRLEPDTIGMAFCVIQGTVETDRMIYVGAHHDSFDGANPSAISRLGTGAAVQDELLRILLAKTKAGWRPRRSIVFGSFDATTLQIGSREWTESNSAEFQSRGVAYLQLGTSVTGSEFVASGSVGLMQLLTDATNNVSALEDGGLLLYNQWKNRGNESRYPILSGYGDHNSFTPYLGIPSIEMKFVNRSEQPWPQSVMCCEYGRYQATPSGILAKLAEAYMAVLLRLSDSAILPYNPAEIATSIRSGMSYIEATSDSFIANNISLVGLRTASKIVLDRLAALGTKLVLTLPIAQYMSDIKLRRISDVLLALTRVFIHPTGTPMIRNDEVANNVNNRNMLIGPLSGDENQVKEFPGVVELLEKACFPQHWKALRKHVAELTLAMDSAVNYMVRSLIDTSVWMRDY